MTDERTEEIRERFAEAFKLPDRNEIGPNGIPQHVMIRQEDLRHLFVRIDGLESRALPVEIVEMLENLAKEREREPEGSYRGEKILNSMEDAILSWWRTRKNEKEI